MAATHYILTETPIKISDGSKAIFIQEIDGYHTKFTSTVSQPNNTTPYCVITKGEVSIPAGFPVWVWRKQNIPVKITVLMSE